MYSLEWGPGPEQWKTGRQTERGRKIPQAMARKAALEEAKPWVPQARGKLAARRPAQGEDPAGIARGAVPEPASDLVSLFRVKTGRHSRLRAGAYWEKDRDPGAADPVSGVQRLLPERPQRQAEHALPEREERGGLREKKFARATVAEEAPLP